MTFTTNPGHLLYPAYITFAASPASPGSINFNINLGGTVASPMEFRFGESWNRYSYVENMPLEFTDPLGLDGNGCNAGGTNPDGPVNCSIPTFSTTAWTCGMGTPQAGLDTLADAFSRLTHPLDMLVVNGTMFFAAGGQMAVGGLAIAGGCLEPTPFELLTCFLGATAGSASIAGGTAGGAFGVYFFRNYTLPAIKDWGCHE
ncbi:MAG TPA: hypothetical protein VE996_09295 [Terriglobales bacterium]|nr:hypothetical protein [Terriglobales bacterium]